MSSITQNTIGVVGAGSWGTTLANLLAEKGYPVTLWVYEQELFQLLSDIKRNTLYLPDIELHPGLRYTRDIKDAVSGKQIVLWVTPVKAFGGLFTKASPLAASDTIHVSASKGIEIDSLKTISRIASEKNPGSAEKFTVLSGPSFAGEVSKKMPSAVVVASKDTKSAVTVQEIMATPYFRTYTSNDTIGVEIGGALKNVIALASGIVEGLGLGHNTRAALITRGLAEIMRLGAVLGADPMTFAGLSGIGDLVLTCTSKLSRNYRVGMDIGEGKKLDDILSSMHQVAEGVHTAKSAFCLAAQQGIDMPIVGEVYKILFEKKFPHQAVRDLMTRDLKKEMAP